MSDPSMITSPFVGLCNKLITRTRVLFPAPLGPTIPKISPLLIFKLTLSTALNS